MPIIMPSEKPNPSEPHPPTHIRKPPMPTKIRITYSRLKMFVMSLVLLAIAAAASPLLFIGGLCLLPVALLAEPPLEALSAANLGGYLYLCLFGAVLAYVLWFDGIAKLPPAAVSSLGLLSPVCAFVLGWLFLGQGMDAKSLAGFALVLASIFGVQRAVGKAT